MNDSPNVRLEASSRLRLEIDSVGVIATVLAKDGTPLVSDNNPARYPWAGVRKTTGEPLPVTGPTAKGKKFEIAAEES